MTNEEWAMEIQAGRAGYGELWEQVRRFIRLQAYKYQTLHAGLCERARIELDDLLQCGFLALRDAVEAYGPERGYKQPISGTRSKTDSTMRQAFGGIGNAIP